MPEYTTEIGINIDKAADLLIQGEIVAVPTETVYGLAGNALSELSVKKIYRAKGRPADNPLIVHVFEADQIDLFARNIPELARQLFDLFSPGALTVVLDKKEIVPDITTGGHSTIALRIPSQPLFRELLSKLPFPLAAPSANPFTGISPTTALAVKERLDGKIPYILDGGQSKIGIESTIVRIVNDLTIEILRHGSITRETLSVYGNIKEPLTLDSGTKTPGSYKKHYSPDTKMLVVDTIEQLLQYLAHYSETRTAILLPNTGYAFSSSAITVNNSVYYLEEDLNNQSAEADMGLDAARNLYHILAEIDKKNYELIIALKLPDKGVGRALNDKLTRAASK